MTTANSNPLIASVLDRIEKRVTRLEATAARHRATGQELDAHGYSRAIAELLVVRSLLTDSPAQPDAVAFPAISWLTGLFSGTVQVDPADDRPDDLRYFVAVPGALSTEVITPHFNDISDLDDYIEQHRQDYQGYFDNGRPQARFWLDRK